MPHRTFSTLVSAGSVGAFHERITVMQTLQTLIDVHTSIQTRPSVSGRTVTAGETTWEVRADCEWVTAAIVQCTLPRREREREEERSGWTR